MATRRIKLARGRGVQGAAEPAPKGPTHLPAGTLVRIHGAMGFYRITGTREIVDGIYETPERIYLCADAFLGATAEGLECHRTHQAAAADVTVVTPAMLTSAIDALEANRDKLEGLLLAMEASEDDAYSEERDGDIW